MRAKPVRPIAGTMGVLTIRQFSLNGLAFLEGLVGGAHTVCCRQRLQLFEESKLTRLAGYLVSGRLMPSLGS